ncbi:MAG: aspartate--tRNA ligase [Candidatus Diapherotrites archaeon]
MVLIFKWKRNCYCSELNKKKKKKVVLNGWIQEKKKINGNYELTLRDFSGCAKILVKKENELFNELTKTPLESVVSIKGKIKKEKKELFVIAEKMLILNKASKLPIKIGKEKDEGKRLKYRYLELRSKKMQENLRIMHEVKKITREYLIEAGFIEIETPVLATHTPEGSSDFFVSSRKNKERKYVLPQSPQLYKQLLMIAGIEKYFQFPKCFRDDFLMEVKQPEFTQLDIEMSFADEKEVFKLMEGLVKKLFKEILEEKIKTPFNIMSYENAMEYYGSDKPDTRFGLKLNDITDELKDTEFKEFKKIIAKKGKIKAFKADCSKLKPKDFRDLHKRAKKFNAKELYLLEVKEKTKVKGKIAKYLSKENTKNLIKKLKAEKNETIFITAGDYFTANNSLRKVRLLLGEKLGLIKKNKWNFLWVNEFPLFEISDLSNRLEAMHNAFIKPMEGHEKLIEKKPLEVKARMYDLVLNGVELGGGGVRTTDAKTLKKVLKKLRYNKKQINTNFGFFLNALNYGVPPHTGIALGLERLVMLLAKEKSIKDVIAFPKNEKGISSMS